LGKQRIRVSAKEFAEANYSKFAARRDVRRDMMGKQKVRISAKKFAEAN